VAEGAVGFLIEAAGVVMFVAEGDGVVRGIGSQREIVRCVENAINRTNNRRSFFSGLVYRIDL